MFKSIYLYFKRLFNKLFKKKKSNIESDHMVKALDDMTKSMRDAQEAVRKFGISYAEAIEMFKRKENKTNG